MSLTSNELNKILNKTRRTPNISLTPEQVEEIVSKLEVLDIIRSHQQTNFNIAYNDIYIKLKKLNDEEFVKVRDCLIEPL